MSTLKETGIWYTPFISKDPISNFSVISSPRGIPFTPSILVIFISLLFIKHIYIAGLSPWNNFPQEIKLVNFSSSSKPALKHLILKEGYLIILKVPVYSTPSQFLLSIPFCFIHSIYHLLAYIISSFFFNLTFYPYCLWSRFLNRMQTLKWQIISVFCIDIPRLQKSVPQIANSQ